MLQVIERVTRAVLNRSHEALIRELYFIFHIPEHAERVFVVCTAHGRVRLHREIPQLPVREHKGGKELDERVDGLCRLSLCSLSLGHRKERMEAAQVGDKVVLHGHRERRELICGCTVAHHLLTETQVLSTRCRASCTAAGVVEHGSLCSSTCLLSAALFDCVCIYR